MVATCAGHPVAAKTWTSRCSAAARQGTQRQGLVFGLRSAQRRYGVPLDEAVDLEFEQSAQPGTSVLEDIGSQPTTRWIVILLRVAALGFLCPNALDVPVQWLVEALEKLLRDPRPCLGIEP